MNLSVVISNVKVLKRVMTRQEKLTKKMRFLWYTKNANAVSRSILGKKLSNYTKTHFKDQSEYLIRFIKKEEHNFLRKNLMCNIK